MEQACSSISVRHSCSCVQLVVYSITPFVLFHCAKMFSSICVNNEHNLHWSNVVYSITPFVLLHCAKMFCSICVNNEHNLHWSNECRVRI